MITRCKEALYPTTSARIELREPAAHDSLAGRRMQSEATLLRARAIGCRDPRMPTSQEPESQAGSHGV